MVVVAGAAESQAAAPLRRADRAAIAYRRMTRAKFSAEMQQRVRDAEALRSELAKQGTDVSALDRAMEAMRAAASQENLKDEKSGGELRTQVIEGLKAYEFALRRAVDGKGRRPGAFRAITATCLSRNFGPMYKSIIVRWRGAPALIP